LGKEADDRMLRPDVALHRDACLVRPRNIKLDPDVVFANTTTSSIGWRNARRAFVGEFAPEFARALANDRVDSESLVELVRRTGDAATSAAELAGSPDSEVRAWLAHALPDLASRQLVPRDSAVAILERMAGHDADSDIRDEAIGSLLQVDPSSAKALVPVLLRRLRSSDYYAPAVAMWTLAEIGSRDAVGEVRAYAERMGDQVWQGREARIVVALMDKDVDALAAQVESHDHDMMHALCRAATLLPADRLRTALEKCAVDFDAECAGRCREALTQVSSHDRAPIEGHP
jgi:hypothetical protein